MNSNQLDNRLGNYVLRLKTEFCLAVAIAVLSGFSCIFCTTPAEAITSSMEALDVVISIDSSGSMKRNDPHNLRKQAAKLFISLLSPRDRVAVISFSTRGEVLAGFENAGDKAGRETLFRAVDKVSSSGLHTDILDALQKALKVQQEEPSVGQEKIVILMTDGKVDTGEAERDAQSIRSLREEMAGKYKAGETRIFSIAFTGESDIELLEDISFKSGGYMAVARNSDELHGIFIQFFEGLKKPEATSVKGNKFLIDSSVSEATLIAKKASPDVQVQLITPSGSVVKTFREASEFQRFSTEAYDLLTMKRPVQGTWSIRFSHGSGNKVVLITDLKLESSMKESFLSKNMRLPVEIYLTRNDELLDDRDILESTRFSLTLFGPSAEDVNTIELFDDGKEGDRQSGDGIFSAEISFHETGAYKLMVSAEGSTFSRVKETAFRVNDWWFIPTVNYIMADGQGFVDVRLRSRDGELTLEKIILEGELNDGENDGVLEFMSTPEGFRASLRNPLKAGVYGVRLKLRPVIDNGATFLGWIEYPEMEMEVEISGADAFVESEVGASVDSSGWGRAVVQFLVVNVLIAGFVAAWIYRRRVQNLLRDLLRKKK